MFKLLFKYASLHKAVKPHDLNASSDALPVLPFIGLLLLTRCMIMGLEV